MMTTIRLLILALAFNGVSLAFADDPQQNILNQFIEDRTKDIVQRNLDYFEATTKYLLKIVKKGNLCETKQAASLKFSTTVFGLDYFSLSSYSKGVLDSAPTDVIANYQVIEAYCTKWRQAARSEYLKSSRQFRNNLVHILETSKQLRHRYEILRKILKLN